MRCITDAGKPAVVPDWQMENLKRMILANCDINVMEGLVKGSEVEIKSEVLKGICGVVVEIQNKNHLAISIEILNRTVIVHLLDECVTGIS